MRFCIKIGAPSYDELYKWGDYYFAKSFGEELKRRGHEYCIAILPEWREKKFKEYEVVVHLRGLSKCKLYKNQFNIMWNISHPSDISNREYEKYDLVLVGSIDYANKLSDKIIVPVYPLLQFVDDNIFNTVNKEDTKDIVFIGNTRNEYRKIVKDMIELDQSIEVYGNGWDQYIDKKYIKSNWIKNSELAKVYSQAFIVLNDHWEDMKQMNFINNRVFDVGCTASILINDYVEELGEVFENIIMYKNKEELQILLEDIRLNSIKYREKSKKLRNEILDKHTVKVRVNEFIEILNKKISNKKSFNYILKKYIAIIINDKRKAKNIYILMFRKKIRIISYIQKIKNIRNESNDIRNAMSRGIQVNLDNEQDSIAFLITEYDEITSAGDKFSALGIGEKIKKISKKNILYYTKLPHCEWYNIDPNIEYIVCMVPEVNINLLRKNKKSKIVAWIRGNLDDWMKINNLCAFDAIITSSEYLERKISEISVDLGKKLLGNVHLGIPVDLEEALNNTHIKFSNREVDISFIGNVYDYSRSIVKYLDINDNVRFEFYGNLGLDNHIWNKYHKGKVEHKDLQNIYLNTKIVIEDIGPRNIGTINLRVFEASACGCLIISNYDEALLELFKEDEIIMYRDKKELNDLINYYLDNEDERICKAKKLHDVVWSKYKFDNQALKFLNLINKI